MNNRTVGDIAARDRPRPILEHLTGLQRRLTSTAILFALGFVAALVFFEAIIRVLLVSAHGNLSTSSTIVTVPTEFITIRQIGVAGFALNQSRPGKQP